MLKRAGILLLSWGLIHVSAYAQDDCTVKMKKAQKMYEEGLIEKIEQFIKPCMESADISKEDKVSGYKLLILAKLYDEKQPEAEQYMLEFLKLEPEYEVNPSADPKEFAELFEDFHTSPLWSVGATVGGNYTLVNSYEEFGPYNTEENKGTYTGEGVSIQLGLKLNRYIAPGWEATLEAIFNQNQYKYTNDIFDFATHTYVESQTRIDIPISFSYTFLDGKRARPFLRAGFVPGLILTAESDQQEKDYFDGTLTNSSAISGAAIDISDQRNSLNYWILGGVGAKYKVKRGSFVAEARYNHGIMNQVKDDSRYSDANLERATTYNFVDNDFTMSNVSFTVGFTYFLYKPRPKKSETSDLVEEDSKKKKEKKPKEAKPKKEKKDKSE